MIFVKIGNEFWKLSGIDDIEELKKPDINSEFTKEFDPEIPLGDDEWFYIKIDDNHKSMIEKYSHNFNNSVGVNNVSEKEFANIDVIFEQHSDKEIVLQKITKSKRLVKKNIF